MISGWRPSESRAAAGGGGGGRLKPEWLDEWRREFAVTASASAITLNRLRSSGSCTGRHSHPARIIRSMSYTQWAGAESTALRRHFRQQAHASSAAAAAGRDGERRRRPALQYCCNEIMHSDEKRHQHRHYTSGRW